VKAVGKGTRNEKEEGCERGQGSEWGECKNSLGSVGRRRMIEREGDRSGNAKGRVTRK